MGEEDFGTSVYGPGPCGHANLGEVVVFSFRSRDGSEHRFHCHAAELPQIMQAMSTAGALAEGARAGQPDGGVMEASKPLFVVGEPSLSIIQKEGLAPLIGAKIPVHQGFPLVFAMDFDTARNLAQGLLAACEGQLPTLPKMQ